LRDGENLVRAAVGEEKARAAGDKQVQAIQASLTASPDDIQKAAAAVGLKVIDTGLFSRGAEMKGVGPQAYFGENPFINTVGKVIGPHSVASARYFYKIMERAPGNADKLESERGAIVATIKERKLRERRELFEDGLIQQLKASGKVTINDDAVKRLGAQYRSSGA
jgi:hypothetical protein